MCGGKHADGVRWEKCRSPGLLSAQACSLSHLVLGLHCLYVPSPFTLPAPGNSSSSIGRTATRLASGAEISTFPRV